MSTESLIAPDAARAFPLIHVLTPPASRRLRVALARSRAEIEAAQRLRYAIFAGEMGAKLHNHLPGLDHDRFDAYWTTATIRAKSSYIYGSSKFNGSGTRSILTA